MKNLKNKHSVLKWALYQRKPLILYIEMKKITRKKTETSAVLQSWSVTEEEPLLAFLLHTAKDISRSRMKQYLAHGQITVNDNPVKQFDYPLKVGMQVHIVRSAPNPLAGNRFIRVVYEDPWLIVIDKKPGILSMQSDHHDFSVKTLLNGYLERKHSGTTVHLVHRLDRDTSGLMVYAKSVDVQQTMVNNWHDIVKDRRYVAVVCGQMQRKRGTIQSWLKDDRNFFVRSTPEDPGDGKWLVTHYQTLDTNGDFSLVELQLETGRKNQIRVHMQDIHHPVAGDPKYGIEGVDPVHRLALHAFRLYFIHPVTHELMKFETPFPASFCSLFTK